MNEAALEARRAYKRKWAKEHPESVKKSQEKYWTRKAAETAAAADDEAAPEAAANSGEVNRD